MRMAGRRPARPEGLSTGSRVAVGGLVGTLVLLAALTILGGMLTRRVAAEAG